MSQTLYGAFWESLVLPRYYKWDVIKTRQASHGLTETRQKGHRKIMLYQGGEREKYTHLRWVDMWKWQRMIPRHKGSPHYRIAHGWKIEYGSFNLEALKFLMHFREPGCSLYFYFYTYSYIFFSFSHISLSFFLFLSHFFLIKNFYLLPFEL
jgi:cellulose synthase/poly-beta-1,6-N-acetylglucosamine synthase-like glycosyltransferase